VVAGERMRAVGEKFFVSAAGVSRWSQRSRERGNAAPDKMGAMSNLFSIKSVPGFWVESPKNRT
jgi:hypothetical protein